VQLDCAQADWVVFVAATLVAGADFEKVLSKTQFDIANCSITNYHLL
jgi:hypothetical protein